jgi:hypothetical protein
MNQPRSPVDPAHFLRSFLVIAFHYVMLFFGLLMGMMLIARVRFPDVFRLWTLREEDRDEFWQAWESQPELLFPTELCLWLILLAVLLSVMIGFLVARWAPFSGAGHGIFLAIISICTFLQISMTQPQIPKWMVMSMLILSPTMIVVTSQYTDRWLVRRAGETAGTATDASDRDNL